MLNERSFQVDTLVASRIIADPANPLASLTVTPTAVTTTTLNGATIQAAPAGFGQVIYSKFTGTPFLLASASATNQVMDQFTLPAGTLTTGHMLRFTIYGIHAADTNTSAVQVTFGSAAGAYQSTVSGGTSIGTAPNLIVSGGVWNIELDFFQSAASVQRSQLATNPGGTAVLANVDTSLTQDMTTSKLVTLAINTATSAASCTIYGWTVVLL